MENQHLKNEIIFVNGEEAKIVLAMQELELRSNEREARHSNGAKSPITFAQTEAERAVLAANLDLQEAYRKELNLSLAPTLVPEPNYPLVQAQPMEMQPRNMSLPFYPAKKSGPSEMELEKLLLERTVLRRKGETIYQYGGDVGYYQKLDMTGLRTLIMKTLQNELSISGQAKLIDNIIKFLLAEPSIEVTDQEQISRYCCLLNGILDLQTGRLLSHGPNFFLTWRLEVAWYGPQECQYCDYYFKSIAGGDSVIIERLWEALGYLILPDYNGKRFVILQGKGDTGKSVFGDLVASFFHADAVGSVDLFKMGDRFAPASLVGKRVNISMDMSDESLSNQAVAFVKQITGRDRVLVEEKYKAPYSTRISCKLLYGSNHVLRTGASDPAFQRRALVIPFRYPIAKEQQIPDLAQRLNEEKPAIFFKALTAFAGVVKNHYRFTGDEAFALGQIEQAGDVIHTQEEILSGFVRECCVPCPGGFVTTNDLYNYYLQYCANQQREGIGSKQVFSTKFRSTVAGYLEIEPSKRRIEGSPQNGYLGLALR